MPLQEAHLGNLCAFGWCCSLTQPVFDTERVRERGLRLRVLSLERDREALKNALSLFASSWLERTRQIRGNWKGDDLKKIRIISFTEYSI